MEGKGTEAYHHVQAGDHFFNEGALESGENVEVQQADTDE